jgi:glycine dehydrogenase
MIPLGSCTMKLNADDGDGAGQLAGVRRRPPVRAGERARQGTLAIVADLERWLAEVTGYAAVSLQPNAGSQGEFAGCSRSPPGTARAARPSATCA